MFRQYACGRKYLLEMFALISTKLIGTAWIAFNYNGHFEDNTPWNERFHGAIWLINSWLASDSTSFRQCEISSDFFSSQPSEWHFDWVEKGAPRYFRRWHLTNVMRLMTLSHEFCCCLGQCRCHMIMTMRMHDAFGDDFLWAISKGWVGQTVFYPGSWISSIEENCMTLNSSRGARMRKSWGQREAVSSCGNAKTIAFGLIIDLAA